MMTAFGKVRLGIVAVALLGGCGSAGGGPTYPDAQVPDGGGTGGGAGSDPGSSGGAGAAAGMSGGTGGGGDGTGGVGGSGKPEPMSGAGNLKVFSGSGGIRFLRSGPTCTADSGGARDRWCAFLAPSTPNIDNTDLWVVNVSRAAAGTPVVCGGTVADPNCLRLTRGFFEETDSSEPVLHPALFRGETLVFFDRAGAPYGWRPGMLNARLLAYLAGGNVRNCSPSGAGTAITCLRDLPESTWDVTISDVLVGRLDAKTDPPLAPVEKVITSALIDGNNQKFQLGWAPGEVLAWSGRQTTEDLETLRALRVDDPGSLRTVATDVSHWSTSADGTRWYWLSKYKTVSGDLQTARFPDGSGVRDMIPAVHDYSVTASGAVVALTGSFELKTVLNPATAPATTIALANGVRGLMAVSDQHVVYLTNFDTLWPLANAFVRRIDGTQNGACTLSTQLDAVQYGFRFTPDSTGLLWARVTSLDVFLGDPIPIDANFTNLSTCARTIVASNVGDGDWGIASGGGLLFIDQSDNDDGTLRMRRFAATPPALEAPPATLIHTRVDSFIPVYPIPGVVLFTVNAGSTKDGLYLNVARGGQPGVDGGVPDGGGPSDGGTSN